MLQHIEKRPDAMWKTNTQWSFRNETKTYGSPMFDAVWAEMNPDAHNPMPEVLKTLKNARVTRKQKATAV